MKSDLSILSIQAAEDLGRITKNLESELNSAKELSRIIKEEFPRNFSYSLIFSDAHFSTYKEKLPPISNKNYKKYFKEISNKLESPYELDKDELQKLVNFCVNLSDYSAMHEEEMRNLKSGPCF